MTSKNKKTPFLYYIKLCASFQIYWWIQTGVTVRKCSIRVKIGDFLSRVTLKFDGWPWKIIRHLFYTSLSFVQQIQTGDTVRKILNLGQNWRIFFPGDFENWRMTLKNNRALLLYYAKLCASFQIHWWSQTWVTAWKRSSQVKIGDFLSRLKVDVWPRKTIGHLSYAVQPNSRFHGKCPVYFLKNTSISRQRNIARELNNHKRHAIIVKGYPYLLKNCKRN